MKFGCIRSPLDLRDYKIKPGKVELPKSFSLEFDHKVKDQRLVNSCTAHATASILEYYANNEVRLSTNFIYGIRRKLFNDTGTGMTLRDACKIVLKYGDMEYADCPGNSEVSRVFDMAESAFKSKENVKTALKYKIKAYVNLLNNVNKIKTFLMNEGPVLCCIKWTLGTDLDDNNILCYPDSDYGLSYHAVFIYGWDNDMWLCQNSWGDEWGDTGLFRLKMSDGLVETFGLMDSKDENLEVVDPTHNSEIIDKLFKIINSTISIITKILKNKFN